MICPYCGSLHTESINAADRYICRECERLFDEEDIVREDLRHEIYHLLDGTDMDNPLQFRAPIGLDEAQGLSSLELPHVDAGHQMPGDGTMWFRIEGPYPDDWHDFDWFPTTDLRSILGALLTR